MRGVSKFSGPSRNRRAMERAVERRVQDALVTAGVLPPAQRELPLGAVQTPELNIQTLLAGAGVIGGYLLDQLHAPLWLAAVTFAGLILSAFVYPWSHASRRRYRLFWTFCAAWVVIATIVTIKYPTPSPHTPTAKEIAQAVRELSGQAGSSSRGHADNDDPKVKPGSGEQQPPPPPAKLPLISAPRITVELDEADHKVKIVIFLKNATDARATATLNAHISVNGVGKPTLVDRTVTFAPQGEFQASMVAYTDADHWAQYVDGTNKVTAELRADYREGTKKMSFIIRGVVEPREKTFDIIENKWVRRP
jgi:hypothetical protein